MPQGLYPEARVIKASQARVPIDPAMKEPKPVKASKARISKVKSLPGKGVTSCNSLPRLSRVVKATQARVSRVARTSQAMVSRVINASQARVSNDTQS